MMQNPIMQYAHPGLLTHPGLPGLLNPARYPSELLAQHMSMISPSQKSINEHLSPGQNSDTR